MPTPEDSLGPELLLVRGEEVLHTCKLEDRPLLVGRAPGNDLVLNLERISRHHAMFWSEDGAVWVKDLGSTNGTFLDEDQLREPAVIPPGGRVRLGAGAEFIVRRPQDTPLQRVLLLEDLSTGINFRVTSDRFVIGSGIESHVRLPEARPREATILVSADGGLWLGVDEEEQPLEDGQEFQLAGRSFRLRRSLYTHVTTITNERVHYPYRLSVREPSVRDPEALLEDLRGGGACTVSSLNRATLLYLLAMRMEQDLRGKNEGPDDLGWCSNEEIALGIWGRNWRNHIDGHLYVLIHRLRKQIEQAGLDPWCIEKKQGHIRARVQEVVFR